MNDFSVGIIGSRDFNDFNLVVQSMQTLFPQATMIVSGGARGADSLGEKYANEFGLDFFVFDALWDIFTPGCRIKYRRDGTAYNADAGFIRNTDIIEHSHAIIAFWDGKSPGTRDSINKAKRLGKRVEIIYFKKM